MAKTLKQLVVEDAEEMLGTGGDRPISEAGFDDIAQDAIDNASIKVPVASHVTFIEDDEYGYLVIFDDEKHRDAVLEAVEEAKKTDNGAAYSIWEDDDRDDAVRVSCTWHESCCYPYKRDGDENLYFVKMDIWRASKVIETVTNVDDRY